jgi:hypothetical protein
MRSFILCYDERFLRFYVEDGWTICYAGGAQAPAIFVYMDCSACVRGVIGGFGC